MFGVSSTTRRLIGALAGMIIATLIVVPSAVRARQRLPHHDLAQHDPIPPRLRLNWNGEAPAAKVKPAPPDERQLILSLTIPTDRSTLVHHSECPRAGDERVPILRLGWSPLLFRGPPATSLS
jgi:hypothetical protein